MTREQLCDALKTQWYLGKDEIDAIDDDREFFHPYLTSALEKRAAIRSIPEDPIDATDVHAIFFLADWGDTTIIPDLLQCLRMSEDDLELLYSDSVSAHMWIPVAKAGHHSLEEIWNFVIDPSANIYARGAAVSGIIAMHHFHPERRNDTVTFIERLLTRAGPFPDDHLAAILCECADHGLTELEERARKFAAALDDDEDEKFVMADGDDIRRAFESGPRKNIISFYASDVFGVNRDWQRWSEASKERKKQPSAPDWMKEHDKLVEEVKRVASSRFERYDAVDTRHSLQDQYRLAMRLREVITSSKRMEELEEYTNADVAAWLVELPFALAADGLVKEAAELGRTWASVTEAENFLGDRAVILAEAALKEEAHQQIEETLRLFPDDVWIRIKTGVAHQALGELDAAEAFYRRALTMSDNEYDRAGVLERLVPLLEELGRTEDARNLEAEEDLRDKKRDSHRSWELAEPIVAPMTSGPKIGRNDPCPCGSGKKYKKCHGR